MMKGRRSDQDECENRCSANKSKPCRSGGFPGEDKQYAGYQNTDYGHPDDEPYLDNVTFVIPALVVCDDAAELSQRCLKVKLFVYTESEKQNGNRAPCISFSGHESLSCADNVVSLPRTHHC